MTAIHFSKNTGAGGNKLTAPVINHLETEVGS
jgi:hypothetical protein